MNSVNKPNKVADNMVVSLAYKLTVNGEVVDSADKNEPLEFLQGVGQIISGLEKAISGMTIGQSKTVTIQPDEAYGSFDPEALTEVPRDDFPTEIPLEVGVDLQVTDEDGEMLEARIVEVKKDSIVLDFNHPLAGKTLVFDVTIVDLREATEEEIAHGHAHGGDFDEDEFDFEEEDDFDEDFEDEDDDEDGKH